MWHLLISKSKQESRCQLTTNDVRKNSFFNWRRRQLSDVPVHLQTVCWIAPVKIDFPGLYAHPAGCTMLPDTLSCPPFGTLQPNYEVVAQKLHPHHSEPLPCHLLCVIFRQLEVCGTLLGSFLSLAFLVLCSFSLTLFLHCMCQTW